jgi:rhamnosyltransferase
MITAIIVSFNPQADKFVPLLERLLDQLDHVIVVDNSPKDSDAALEQILQASLPLERVSLCRIGDNLGIAAALNIGIGSALDEGADFILLSDQDSLPANDMVKNLKAAYDRLSATGVAVGAIGPTFTDQYTGYTYPFQADIPGRFFYGHRAPTAEQPDVEALTLITSGTLIPASVLHDVGPMREDFFIDHVDIEWCHRARSRDYTLFGNGQAKMLQSMGEDNLRVWYFGWLFESEYTPVRMYYRIRNYVALTKLDYIDWRWKMRSAWYWTGFVYAHVIFGRRGTRLGCLRMAARGLLDGVRGHMGRLSPGEPT